MFTAHKSDKAHQAERGLIIVCVYICYSVTLNAYLAPSMVEMIPKLSTETQFENSALDKVIHLHHNEAVINFFID